MQREENWNNSCSVVPIPVSTYMCYQRLNSHILLGLLNGMLGNKVFSVFFCLYLTCHHNYATTSITIFIK